MIKILFLCHGNICRSTMAEFLMKHLVAQAGRGADFHIESAATSREEIGRDTHPGTKRKLAAVGVPVTRRAARQVTKADYGKFDYLIVMDEANIRGLNRIIGSDPEGKVHKLLSFAGKGRDIADPWYTGNFDDTYDDIAEGLQAFMQYLDKKEAVR